MRPFSPGKAAVAGMAVAARKPASASKDKRHLFANFMLSFPFEVGKRRDCFSGIAPDAMEAHLETGGSDCSGESCALSRPVVLAPRIVTRTAAKFLIVMN